MPDEPTHRVDVVVLFDNGTSHTYRWVREWAYRPGHWLDGGFHPARWVIKPRKDKLPPYQENGYDIIPADRVLSIGPVIFKGEGFHDDPHPDV